MKHSMRWSEMEREPDQPIDEAVARESPRLRSFIRRRVTDPEEVEDILQEVFYELVEANRLLVPIDHIAGWLFRVARNRITDLFRRKKPEPRAIRNADGVESGVSFEDLLPSPDAGPDALFARRVLIEELEEAIAELPPDQRDVFVAHEIEGRSFREMAEESGTSINTLLSRKRYAVLQLRERLREVHEAFRDA